MIFPQKKYFSSFNAMFMKWIVYFNTTGSTISTFLGLHAMLIKYDSENKNETQNIIYSIMHSLCSFKFVKIMLMRDLEHSEV